MDTDEGALSLNDQAAIIPDHIAAAILRTLEKEPQNRFEPAGALAAALKPS